MAVLERQSEVVRLPADGAGRSFPSLAPGVVCRSRHRDNGAYPDRDEILPSPACRWNREGDHREGLRGDGPSGGLALEPIVEALTDRVLVAHGASRHIGFLSAVFQRSGLRLCRQALDTAVLAAWVPSRAPADGDRPCSPADISPGLSEAASAIGMPVHRPHEAGGEALTTAQLFIALASHLDRLHPQSVGSLARLCSKNGDCNRRAAR
jgi:hypothetical protein